MKKSWIKKISLSLACLLGISGLIGAVLSSNKEVSQVEASTLYEELTLDKIIKNGKVSSDYGDGWVPVGNFKCWGVKSLSSNSVTVASVTHFRFYVPSGITIGYTSITASTTQTIRWYLDAAGGEIAHDVTSLNYSQDVSVSGGSYFFFQTENFLTKTDINLNSLSIKVYQGSGAPSEPVTIAKGTGIKSVYLSTSSTATSGSASGTNYNPGTTVYGFAELDKGYSAKSGWTLVSGTAGSEGAKYRVGSVSAGSNNFGTISADLSQYTISYELNGGTATNPTSYSVTSNTFTLANPTRTGYTFKGWSGTDLTGDENLTVTVSKGSIGNRSYTANWVKNTYTISYNLNGGTVATLNPETYDIESSPITLVNPTKTGYVFDGWNGTDIVDGEMEVIIPTGSTGDREYTATWVLADELKDVIDAIDDIGGPSNVTYPGSKDAIENAEALYNGLDNEYKAALEADFATKLEELTDDRSNYEALKNTAINNVISAISNIGDLDDVSYPESHDVINAATSSLDGIDDDDLTLITNYTDYENALNKYNEEREQAIADVIGLINDIGEVSYPDSKDAIDAAREAYNALAEEDKAAVTNYSALTSAETTYEDLKQAGVNSVKDLINAIGEVSLDSESGINAARSAFDALTEEQKALVDNYETLIAAETRYNELATAKAEADDVVAKIDAIGEVTYPDSKDAINEARAAYDALNEDGESFVSNYPTLENAENAYASLRNDAISNVEDLIDAIDEVSYPDSKDAIDAARDAYNALAEEDKIAVSNYVTLTTDENAYEDLKQAGINNVKDLINAIGEVSYPDSKDAIDAARSAYDALTDEQKALVTNYETLTAAEARYNELVAAKAKADDVIAKIDAIGEVTYPDSKDAINEARAAYDALNEDGESFVSNYPVLLEAEAQYELLKQAGANNVKVLINVIGEVSLDSESGINAARSAFDALTEEQKALVDNYETLIAAEARYNELVAAKAKADDVIAKIDAIGEVTYPDSKDAINEARAAYDALNEDGKAYVTNYSTLTDAEAQYESLKQTGVNDIKDLIDAIGEVEYTDACKGKIGAARAAYDALTDEQKALVNNYKALTHAEEVYNHVDEVVTKIEKIGDVTLDSGSDIEAAKEAYDTLSEEEKELISSYHNTLVGKEEAYVKLVEDKNTKITLAIVFGIIGGIILLAAIAYVLMMFVFNKWIKVEDKAIRVLPFALGKKDDKARYLSFKFRFEYREKENVFKSKKDALK